MVRTVGAVMKERLPCDRVYVATLCDGVEHLHYHLIPRYPTDIRGFAFVGQREFACRAGYTVGPKDPAGRVEYLQDLAKLLRF
jgi:diadenosine tetraphosphate (Ap4A) HIT family hydrolase